MTTQATKRPDQDSMALCSVSGCGRALRARGLCPTHWFRWRVNGDVDPERPVGVRRPLRPALERFHRTGWEVTPSGCWEWRGARQAAGYGSIKVEGKARQTHRIAYETWVGPIPAGMLVMHSCDNPPCINPEHLSIGTTLDNARDKEAKGRGKYGPNRPGKVVHA